MTRVARWTVAIVLVAAMAVAGVVLTQGDDDPFADYCATVTRHQAALGAAFSAGSQTGLLRALPIFKALAKDAPADIRDEWRTVIDRVTALRDALRGAGVDPATYDATKPPAGLSPADQSAITAAATSLGSQETATALTGVDQQVRDVCKTPLSL